MLSSHRRPTLRHRASSGPPYIRPPSGSNIYGACHLREVEAIDERVLEGAISGEFDVFHDDSRGCGTVQQRHLGSAQRRVARGFDALRIHLEKSDSRGARDAHVIAERAAEVDAIAILNTRAAPGT